MGFITGLKNLFTTPIYAVIVGTYIIAWILAVYGYTFIPDQINYLWFILVFLVILLGFCFVLFIFSFFKAVDKMGKITIFIALIISVPTLFMFNFFAVLLFAACLVANQLLTAFFAFKACMDTSTKVDDYLYKKKG